MLSFIKFMYTDYLEGIENVFEFLIFCVVFVVIPALFVLITTIAILCAMPWLIPILFLGGVGWYIWRIKKEFKNANN